VSLRNQPSRAPCSFALMSFHQSRFMTGTSATLTSNTANMISFFFLLIVSLLLVIFIAVTRPSETVQKDHPRRGGGGSFRSISEATGRGCQRCVKKKKNGPAKESKTDQVKGRVRHTRRHPHSLPLPPPSSSSTHTQIPTKEKQNNANSKKKNIIPRRSSATRPRHLKTAGTQKKTRRREIV
jgi:hypothetical protein